MLKYACIVGSMVGLIWSPLAQGQERSGSFVGSVPAHDNCPAVTLHIIRSGTSSSGGSNLTGVIFYSDGSGVSKATGEITPEGKVKITMTPDSGRGVAGEIEGTLLNNQLDIHSVQNPNCGLATHLYPAPSPP